MIRGYNIYGESIQAVEVVLAPGDQVYADPGTMVYMSHGVTINTGTGRGVLSGIKRMIVGESFFVSRFQYDGHDYGRVAFSAPFPGKIMPIDLSLHDGEYICQKNAFLCASIDVGIGIAFTKKLGAGFFGGEGFILQRLSGHGTAFVHAGGAIVEHQLAAGEHLNVETGCLVGFSRQVTYDIKFVGGFTNALFGGEGLFFAHLVGPGSVLVQSLPFSRLVDRITEVATERHAAGGS
jgi:uncharacterized protein (TIGR00266 family)